MPFGVEIKHVAGDGKTILAIGRSNHTSNIFKSLDTGNTWSVASSGISLTNKEFSKLIYKDSLFSKNRRDRDA